MLFCQVFRAPPGVFLMKYRPDPVLWQHKYQQEQYFLQVKEPGKGFSIPTPVGHYSPDWAIAFNEGTVKHIFFVAETKGTMESMQLRPIEKAKIMCARKLFNDICTDNVVYHDVDSYQSLLNIMNDPSLDKKVCE